MAIETVFLDFDGTLARRVGGWTNTLVEMVTSAGHRIDRDTLAPHMHQGFPWHRYELGHDRLLNGGGWWDYVLRVLETALISAGVPATAAADVVSVFPAKYVEPSAFAIYDDTKPALEQLRSMGYRCFVASNHTPELPDIVRQIGLGSYVDGVFSSAIVGFDKPHHGFYRAVLEGAGATAESSVMIGDNYIADVTGARAMGMSAIHVRSQQVNEYLWHANTLSESVDMVAALSISAPM